jgi:acetolactate decarboxylase
MNVVERDGVPRVPADAETAVNLVEAPFQATNTRQHPGPTTCQRQLTGELAALLPSPNGIYALRVAGQFRSARARSFLGWDPPYPDALILAGDGQVFFDLRDVAGRIVALHLPATADTFCSLGAGCAQNGFHFHFLTDDHRAGGHLLECDVESAIVEITVLRELRLHMPGGAIETLYGQ